ncbi:hypothetical protein TrLO_g15026 [Triparma laevis f. longispina]|uniref:RBR-type E3 ubiquitin transferase n=1 Tax=Triparma laevis f. longispina TaxID=1714387 RepID=A0A9W6ZTF5_9STRA|nr:hypothetical protein TrLO_g15026 [Triparma laevis f. longispina]
MPFTKWTCLACTFVNEDPVESASNCMICEADRPPSSTSSPRPPASTPMADDPFTSPPSISTSTSTSTSASNQWECAHCTFMNEDAHLACTLCLQERVDSTSLIKELDSQEKEKKASLILANGACNICREDDVPTYNLRDCSKTCTCCEDCLKKYVELQIEEQPGVPIRCPFNISNPDCCPNIDINQTDIMLLSPTPTYNRHIDKQTEYACAREESLHMCPTPNCNFKVEWVSHEENGQPILDCKMCNNIYCLLCRQLEHTCMTCEEKAAETLPENATEEAKRLHAEERASKKALSKIRKCGGCGEGVLKKEGCNKILCRCGYKFCFKCGDEGATCSCTPANVRNYKQTRFIISITR